MPRPRYTITKSDYKTARDYIARKFFQNASWPAEDDLESIRAERSFKRTTDVTTLNAWCEKWLTAEQWTQLKNAVRATRKRRAALAGEGRKHISLTHRAWLMLSNLSMRDGITISEWLEENLEDEWQKHC